MLNPLRTLAQLLFGSYQLFRVFRLELRLPVGDEAEYYPESVECRGLRDVGEITALADEDLHRLVHYAGSDAYGYVALENGRIVAVCWLWGGGVHYRTQRNFLPLASDEAEVVRIQTTQRCQRRGVAPQLLRYAAGKMRDNGFRALYARIWHTYHPSLRAFDRAGWTYYAFIADIFPLPHRGRKRIMKKARQSA